MPDYIKQLIRILERPILGNTIKDYAISLSIIVLGIILLKYFKNTIISQLKKWAEKTKTEYDNFLILMGEKTIIPLIYFGIFYLGLKGLLLHETLNKSLRILGMILFTYFAVKFTIGIVEFILQKHWLGGMESATSTKLRKMFPAIRVGIWIVGIVFLLDNLGFKISTVIATLGIGGVAVALASQAILKDLFSYFSILFDRPFEPGDFIIIGDFMGSVEHIGVKTTRIRSLGGEQLVFSNSDLTDSRIRNYKRMDRRRVVFKFGVTYQTPEKQLKEIPGIVADIIGNIEKAILDRAHFQSYGDSGLIFEIVYYVETSEYNKYMDIQQSINLALNREFADRKIEFAYPTQTLYVAGIEKQVKEA